MRRSDQGNLGELIALPLGRSPDWDLIAELDGALVRVQVKTSARRRADRWVVTLCTKGGNQSWSGTVRRFDRTRCDRLFVAVTDGRRWFIPASEVAGATEILVGGPKYAEFEVEAGATLLRVECSALWGDARVVKGDRL